MKKFLTIFASASFISAPVFSVVACGGSDSTIKIAFVPSQNATEVTATVSKLEEKLKAEMIKNDSTFSKNIKITTATNYEAAGDAMKKGKTDLAFLPVNTYESYRGTKQTDGTYKDAGILLVASRESLAAESKFKDFQTDGKFDDTKAAGSTLTGDQLSGLAADYNKLLSDTINVNGDENSDKKEVTRENVKGVLFDSSNDVSYYRSYIYANKTFLKNTLGDAVPADGTAYTNEQLKELVDAATKNKKFGIGASPTSSASVLYPLHWLKKQLEYSNTEIKNIYENKLVQANYTDAAQGLGTNKYDLAVGFADIRYDLKDDSTLVSAFKNSVAIGSTIGIPNDGIMYSRKTVDATLASNLRTSLISLIEKPENSEIFGIYSHTGYVGPTSATEATTWEVARDNIVTTNLETIKDIKDLVTEISA